MRIDELEASDLDRLSGLVDKHRQKNLAELRSGIEKAKQDGGLIKREFNDLKQHAGRVVENIAELIKNETYYPRLRANSVSENVKEVIGYGTPTSYTQVQSFLKKLKKLDSNDPSVAAMMAAMQAFMPVVDQLNHLKEMIVPFRSKAAKTADSYVAPSAERSDADMVALRLREITQAVADEQQKQFMAIFDRFISTYLDDQRKKDKIVSPLRYYAKNPLAREIAQGATEQTGYRPTDPYRRKENAEEFLRERSKRLIEEIHQKFIARNTQKLAPIVSTKGNLKSTKVTRATVRGGIIEANIRITFDDGSAFSVLHQLVLSTSHLGTMFYRFPTTFHDVILPDGSRMARPSEERMNTVFAKA